MSLRQCCMLLSAIVALAQAGCCGLNCCPINWGPGGSLRERTRNCCSCGPRVWHEWFSFPPMCCDNCNQCGQFTASSNPYVMSGPPYGKYGPLYDDGSGRPGQPRSPAARGILPPSQPTPAEELPPGQPSTGRNYRDFGDRVSFERPLDEPRRLRDVRGMQYDDEEGGYDRPYDDRRYESGPPSRKLGRPSRPARLVR